MGNKVGVGGESLNSGTKKRKEDEGAGSNERSEVFIPPQCHKLGQTKIGREREKDKKSRWGRRRRRRRRKGCKNVKCLVED